MNLLPYIEFLPVIVSFLQIFLSNLDFFGLKEKDFDEIITKLNSKLFRLKLDFIENISFSSPSDSIQRQDYLSSQVKKFDEVLKIDAAIRFSKTIIKSYYRVSLGLLILSLILGFTAQVIEIPPNLVYGLVIALVTLSIIMLLVVWIVIHPKKNALIELNNVTNI